MIKEEQILQMFQPAKGNIADMWTRDRILSSETPVDDTFLLSWQGKPFVIKSGLVALKGKPKCGKSFALAMMVAVMMGDEYDGLECLLEGMRVLYIDTEQLRGDSVRIMQRIAAMSGCPDLDERLALINMRCHSPKERMTLMEYAIDTFRPDVVVIDNAADMLEGMDYNNITAAADLVTRLTAMSEERQCTFICAIHENGNDGRATGWAGRIFLQKCDLELTVVKEKVTGVRRLCPTACRHADFQPIRFELRENADRIVLPFIMNDVPPAPGVAARSKFDKQFDGVQWGEGLRHGVLIDQLVSLHGKPQGTLDDKGVKNERDKFRKRIDKAFRAGYLIHTGDLYMPSGNYGK